MIISPVERHYARGGLIEAIRDGLARLGKGPGRLTPADLASIDEFHVRGRAATKELAGQLHLAPASLVLDIGAGLGGAARFLAGTYGCRVIGLDLSEEYCRTAEALARWVGLADRVSFRRGSALDLPFADYQFDVAWTQHAAMNIADKATLYAEAFRVLKPGGRFALYDVQQGDGGPIHLPVPWARHAEISHLVAPQELRRLLGGAGFEIIAWRDTTAAAREAFAAIARQRGESGPPPLGLGLLLGEDFAAMNEAMRRNLDENRIALIEAVCVRPG